MENDQRVDDQPEEVVTFNGISTRQGFYLKKKTSDSIDWKQRYRLINRPYPTIVVGSFDGLNELKLEYISRLQDRSKRQ